VQGGEPLSLLKRRPPSAFERRVVVVPPGAERPYDEAEWLDAVVVVERGTIELDCPGGASLRLPPGSVLWLAGLPLRALCNRGPELAVLAGVRRRPMSYRSRDRLDSDD
jgi:hypothetical protein